jgi:hypothetical protein
MGWVLLPPLLLATSILVFVHRRNADRTLRRTAGGVFLLVTFSACIAIGLLVFSPAQLGRYIGIRDNPIMWAPFAFIAVALALPVAMWWVGRQARP